jgi:hypothetical protein
MQKEARMFTKTDVQRGHGLGIVIVADPEPEPIHGARLDIRFGETVFGEGVPDEECRTMLRAIVAEKALAASEARLRDRTIACLILGALALTLAVLLGVR